MRSTKVSKYANMQLSCIFAYFHQRHRTQQLQVCGVIAKLSLDMYSGLFSVRSGLSNDAYTPQKSIWELCRPHAATLLFTYSWHRGVIDVHIAQAGEDFNLI